MKMKVQEKFVMKFLVLLLAMLLVMIPLVYENIFAATSSVSISDGSPDVGDSFTVTIYYSGDSFGSVDGALTYDSSILRFEDSTESNVNGGNGEVSFSHYQTSGDDSMAITFYFTVIGSGSSSVTAYSSDIYNYDGNSLGGDTASASFTVNGTAAQTNTEDPNAENEENEDNGVKSSNANLSFLAIACGDLSPAFSPDITSYTVTASATETNVGIEAYTEDDDADWDVTGSPEFTEDEVTRVVTVTAADGTTTKNYSIKITRNNPEGGVIYDGTLYTPSQNQKLDEVPAGFLSGKLNYNGKELNVLKSRDGNVNLIRLAPEGGSDDDALWFVFNPETQTFTPSEIVTVDGNKYVVIRDNVALVYGGPESSSSYQLYDFDNGTLNTVNISNTGNTNVEPTENPTEPSGEGEVTTPEGETKPAETKSRGKGIIWFIVLVVLALVAALLYMLFRDKFGNRNKSAYSTFEEDEDENEENESIGNKILLTFAGLKESISSKLANRNSDDIYSEESGMSERRIERRRRIAEAEAREAEALAAGTVETTTSSETVNLDNSAFIDSTPISEGSVVTKAELEAAKIAAAEKAREEAERAAEEAKAAREAAAAAIAARDAARSAKARVASSELDSAMEELLEVGEALNETVNKKDE